MSISYDLIYHNKTALNIYESMKTIIFISKIFQNQYLIE